MQFHRLKVIAKDFNKVGLWIWHMLTSLQNTISMLRTFLVAVDCLARYLRAYENKKYATEAAAFKKGLKINKPKKYGSIREKMFSEFSKDSATQD